MYLWIKSFFDCIQIVFVVVVGSFQSLSGLQWNRVPSILLMRTKSQGNEVSLYTYYHSNLIRTTPLLIGVLIVKIQNQKSFKLSYNIYYKTHSQLYMRPTINQSIVPTTITIIVALSNHLQCSFPLLCSSIHSITLQNFTKPKSAFSVKLFQIPNAKWTPVLINKIWYYKMHQESS